MELTTPSYDQYLKMVNRAFAPMVKEETGDCLKSYYNTNELISRFAPKTFLIDLSTQKFLQVTEPPISGPEILREMDLSEYLEMYSPDYRKIALSDIIPDNLNFLKLAPLEKYGDYVFSYNYKLLNSSGNYSMVLQRYSFVPGKRSGKPAGIIGVIFDITHFKEDNSIVHTIEETGHVNDGPFNRLVFKKIHLVNNLSCATRISKRELQVLNLLADGLSTKQIAGSLKISRHTVNIHRKNLRQKTGCKTSPEIYFYAIKNGLI